MPCHRYLWVWVETRDIGKKSPHVAFLNRACSSENNLICQTLNSSHFDWDSSYFRFSSSSSRLDGKCLTKHLSGDQMDSGPFYTYGTYGNQHIQTSTVFTPQNSLQEIIWFLRTISEFTKNNSPRGEHMTSLYGSTNHIIISNKWWSVAHPSSFPPPTN